MTQLWQIKQVESVFHSDRFDLQDYMDATAAYPRLAVTNDRSAAAYCGQPGQDAFFDLYKAAPRLKDPTPAGLSPLRSLIDRARETPDYEKLRANSRGDLVSAAVGAEVYVDKLMASLPEEVKKAAKEQAKQQAAADRRQAEADNANEFADLLAELAQQAEDAGQGQDYRQQAAEAYQAGLDARAEAERLQAEADQWAEAADRAISDNESQIMAALNQAAGKADQEAGESRTLVRSFSLAGGADPGQVSPDQARQIMELLKNNPHFLDLADLIGWARQMVRAEWRKSPHGNVELTGYRKQALQPSRMASFEMAKMVSNEPALRQDWQRRAVDNAVEHRHYRGEQQQDRGDMVLVRDESGSMDGPEHSTAVALEWALLEIARRDHRGFVSIPFSGSGDYRVWRVPETGQDIDGLLAHLSHFYGGGTEPYAPLARALDEIEIGGLKADILLLTDGSFADPPAPFLQQLVEVRQKMPVKLVTVVIGVSTGGHVAGKFSDRVIYINDLFAGRERLRQAVAEVV